MVEPTLEDDTQAAIIDLNPEALLVTLEMRQLLSQLTPEEISAPPSAPESTITIVEMRSGSAPAVTRIATMDILEELTLQMIE